MSKSNHITDNLNLINVFEKPETKTIENATDIHKLILAITIASGKL